MPRISVVYFDAGGGHLAASRALLESIRRRGLGWEMELVNLDQILEPIDPLFRLTGLHGSTFYNWALRHHLTFASGQWLPMMHAWIRMLHGPSVRLLRQQWRQSRPDLVLSVIPHYNRSLLESLQAELPGTPYVTLLTDLADYPPRFWFERQDQHFICGTEEAAAQASSLCSPGSRIWKVSGMVLHPRFHDQPSHDRVAGRRSIGLEPDLPTGVVLFGGYGSRRMVEIAQRLKQSRVQMIFLCGHNAKLAARLRSMALPYPFHVQEFTDDVPFYMRLSDFFVGKPGPGALSEALAMHLPVIVEADLSTMVHERFNTHWIHESQLGLVISGFRDLPGAIEQLLDPRVYRSIVRRIKKMNNTAAAEILEILEHILAGQPTSALAG